MCIASLFFLLSTLPAGASASPATTGLLVPLYAYPGPIWTSLIAAKSAHPDVPIIAIVNPDGGPGWHVDQNITAGVKSLQSAGITAIGYVWTNYGARPINDTEADIITYKNWYGVDGIYFDQMPTKSGSELYYSTLNNFVKSLGMKATVGNAGETDLSPSYVGTLDTIIIYENWGVPNLSALAAWQAGYSKNNLAVIAYGVSTFNQTYIQQLANDVGYLYITDAGAYNTYFPLPTYLAAQMSVLDSIPVPQLTVKISSEALDGLTQVYGIWTTVQAPSGATVASGYTPLTFGAVPGVNYSIRVSNFGNYTLDHWDDGSLGLTRGMTFTQPVTTLTAYFRDFAPHSFSSSTTTTTNTTTVYAPNDLPVQNATAQPQTTTATSTATTTGASTQPQLQAAGGSGVQPQDGAAISASSSLTGIIRPQPWMALFLLPPAVIEIVAARADRGREEKLSRSNAG